MNDAYSLKILEALQEDSRMTVQQISERVGLSTTPCWKRIKEMMQNSSRSSKKITRLSQRARYEYSSIAKDS